VNSVRNDTETMACAVCGTAFRRSGRRLHCSQACRQAAWRRRSQAPREPIVAKPDTVYQCPMCEVRLIGEQYCEECHSFARRLGPAAPVLAVMSRSPVHRAPPAGTGSRRARVKRRHEEVIREQDRRKGAAIPSTGIDYFSGCTHSAHKHGGARDHAGHLWHGCVPAGSPRFGGGRRGVQGEGRLIARSITSGQCDDEREDLKPLQGGDRAKEPALHRDLALLSEDRGRNPQAEGLYRQAARASGSPEPQPGHGLTPIRLAVLASARSRDQRAAIRKVGSAWGRLVVAPLLPACKALSLRVAPPVFPTRAPGRGVAAGSLARSPPCRGLGPLSRRHTAHL